MGCLFACGERDRKADDKNAKAKTRKSCPGSSHSVPCALRYYVGPSPADRMTRESIILTVLTLAAAIVNGALGYGFSSITVPVALLFLTNRVLNPALVPIE